MNGFDESFARQEFSRVEKVSYEGRTPPDKYKTLDSSQELVPFSLFLEEGQAISQIQSTNNSTMNYLKVILGYICDFILDYSGYFKNYFKEDFGMSLILSMVIE